MTTKGRKTNPAATSVDDDTDLQGVARKSEALTVLGTRSAEIAERFDDGLPYERNRIVSEARFYMGQSAEAMLEAGKRLIVLKENEPHGEFTELVEQRLGLNERTARRMMAAAVKYLSPALASKATALSVLGKTKLLELMVEDDAALEGLAEGGTIAGKDLDDLQAMTSRELRAALVEARKKTAAKDAVIAKKDQKLNELTEAEERRRSGKPSEREQAQLDDLRDAALKASIALAGLVAVVDDVTQAAATEAAELAARQTLDFVAQRFTDACSTRGLAVDVCGELVEPGFLRPISDAIAKLTGQG